MGHWQNWLSKWARWWVISDQSQSLNRNFPTRWTTLITPLDNALAGLPLPKPDQTEEMLVEAMLKVVNLPAATVRTAVRLPVKSKVRS